MCSCLPVREYVGDLHRTASDCDPFLFPCFPFCFLFSCVFLFCSFFFLPSSRKDRTTFTRLAARLHFNSTAAHFLLARASFLLFFFCPRAFRFAFVLCRFVCFFSFFGFDSFRVASAFGGGPFFGAHSPFLPFIEFDFACFSLFFALFFAFAGSPLTAKRGCVRKYAVRNNSIDTAAMVGEQCRRSIETLMEFEGNRSL